MRNKAVFLDRDGTVIIDVGYLNSPDNIEFIDGVGHYLQKIKKAGYLLILVSNQSGVARGYFSEKVVQEINERMNNMLCEEYGVSFDGMYYCPHHSEKGIGEYKVDCNCRKPRPGMILRASEEHNIDISQSIMVGDKESDRIDLDELRFIKVKKDLQWVENKELMSFINSLD